MKELSSLTKLSYGGIERMRLAYENYRKARAMKDELLAYGAKKFKAKEMENAGWWKRWRYGELSDLEFLKAHTPAFYGYYEILPDVWTEAQYDTYICGDVWYDQAVAVKTLLNSGEQDVYVENVIQRFINVWSVWDENLVREGMNE